MINIGIDILINRSVDHVWTFMTSITNVRLWMSDVIEAQGISGSSMGVGLKVRKVQRFWGLVTDMIYDTTEYDPNRKIAYKTFSGTMSKHLSYEASITLESVGAGTKLIYSGNGALRGFLRPAEPLFAYAMKRRFRKDFNNLKELVEAPAKAVARGVDKNPIQRPE
jgi:hypothetical protein